MGVRVLNRRKFHYDDNPIANPADESVQDKSYREWRENFERVSADPESASITDLMRAIGYLDKVRSRITRKAWEEGRTVDANVLASYDNEQDYYQSLITRKRGRNPSTVGEVGKSLSKDQKRLVLESMRDVYKENRLDKEEKGSDYRGETILGYPYAPEYFKQSSITGRMIRYYITLPDGRIAHPTEVYPNLRQSEVDREIQAREYAEKEEQQRIADKLKRVVEPTHSDPMQEANIRYYKTNRPREGSYFAYDDRGRIVRVDGNDSKDARFWEDRGFFKR